ncbi:MAG TPA: FAD-containing oxidoreductase, partial [Candidatus Saccharimonadales bacterium]|nr:FAD-containing oxidoreductase [Candidatus Saccharimonadales bacterium]
LGVIGPVIYALGYAALTVLLFPASFVTLGAGTLFGLKTGLFVALAGANLGALCSFLLARTFLRQKVMIWTASYPKFRFLDEAIGRQGFKMVMLCRLSPIFPFILLNYFLGLTAVRTAAYVLANLLGMLPAMFLLVYAGASARVALEVQPIASADFYQQILKYVGLAATVAVVVVVTRLARKALREAEQVQESNAVAGKARLAENYEPTSFDKMLAVDDAHDKQLLENCRPPRWVNPTPAKKYNLVVIGAGTAGLVSAAAAAGLGAKVALVERNLLGGDCLNVGCVPSKSILRAARAAHDAENVLPFGIALASKPEINFGAVMERMRKLRADISRHDSVERFTKLGVDVFIGSGRFASRSAIEVEGKRLQFDRAVIATGGRPKEPPIQGLREAGYYTNETVFTLTELPRRLAVIGAGPIGCELAQAFQRFGSAVTLITDGSGILAKEDRDAADVLHRQLEKDGVRIITGGKIQRVEAKAGEKQLMFTINDQAAAVGCDAILVAVGRAPNVENLGLDEAGIGYSIRGVDVDERLRTTHSRVFAAGDVCSRYQYTHAADAMARIVVANALFLARRKVTDLVMPWCTYTDPEIAHVGYYEEDACAAGFDVATLTQRLSDIDRARLDGETQGFARVHYDKKTARILGGTIVARHAGEMIGELTLAITAKQKIGMLSATIHPYPTQAEALHKIGDAYMRTKLTAIVQVIFKKWLAWRR